jgi:hypothetical protein
LFSAGGYSARSPTPERLTPATAEDVADATAAVKAAAKKHTAKKAAVKPHAPAKKRACPRTEEHLWWTRDHD